MRVAVRHQHIERLVEQEEPRQRLAGGRNRLAIEQHTVPVVDRNRRRGHHAVDGNAPLFDQSFGLAARSDASPL